MCSTSKRWGLPYLFCAASVLVAGLSTPPARAGTVTIALTGDTVPEGNGEFTFFSGNDHLLPLVQLNSAGQVMFSATLQNTSGGGTDNYGMYLHDGSQLIKIVREGDAVPEGNGVFSWFRRGDVNATGQVAISADLRNTSGGTLDSQGFYLYDGLGLINLVRIGDAAPDGDGEFSWLDTETINDAGQVVFGAGLRNNSGGTEVSHGLYLHTGSGLIELAREGDAVPEGNGEIGSFDDGHLNNAGQAAFWTLLAPDQAIFEGFF